MGLFNFLKQRSFVFQPNFRKSEYDNRLDFIAAGGTTQEWERLKAVNGWRFRESELERYERYQKELKLFWHRICE